MTVTPPTLMAMAWPGSGAAYSKLMPLPTRNFLACTHTFLWSAWLPTIAACKPKSHAPPLVSACTRTGVLCMAWASAGLPAFSSTSNIE
ncbi:hypothetical protein D3C77_587790 [compost metagenome]